MKVLVIGCGSIGNRHIENISSLGNHEVFASDTDGEALRRVKNKFGLNVFEDLDVALKDEHTWRHIGV